MTDLENAANILKSGGVVAFPTETVYGLGACISAPAAVARIFEIKERPFFDPLIVHLAHASWLAQIVDVPDTDRAIVDKFLSAFWPGPLTILLPKKTSVADIVTSGLEKVGVRVPAHPMAKALLELVGQPVCAPSANKFGKLSPTTADHVRHQLGNAVDFILDGGDCSVGVESTVVQIENHRVQILRPGGVTSEALEAVLNEKVETVNAHHGKILAPGQVESHYAPRTRLRILSPGVAATSSKKKGLLAWNQPKVGYAAVEVLSPTSNMQEAAVRLFACLHRLDQLHLEVIEVEPVEEVGLGVAIMNRLKKAQATFQSHVEK